MALIVLIETGGSHSPRLPRIVLEYIFLATQKPGPELRPFSGLRGLVPHAGAASACLPPRQRDRQMTFGRSLFWAVTPDPSLLCPGLGARHAG